ncbi:hypothetical protein ACFYXD_25640 [Streptomyces platensis]|uniref:hypothetical protein n=1 Tax=Streptomyces platensis TaxID=58346 RepID=UPI00368D88D4
MGNAGGAATNSGIDFQQRIAALVMSQILCDVGDFSSLRLGAGVVVDELRFETNDEIDDLVLVGPALRVFVQAKHALSVSASADSEFSSVLRQFVHQYLGDSAPGDVYLLATSPVASSRVTRELRKLTEAARLNETNHQRNPLTKVEKEVLEKTDGLIDHHYRARTGRDITAADRAAIFRRIRVALLDIEAGGALESAMLMLLASRCTVSPHLVWGDLVSMGVSLAKDRVSIDRAGLSARMGRYFGPGGAGEPADEAGAGGVLSQVEFRSALSAGREVVLAELPDEDGDCVIADFRRFDERGDKRLTFRDDRLQLPNGISWRVLGRWSTWAGLERYMERHAERFADREVVLIPMDSGVDCESLPHAQVYGEHCRQVLEAVPDILCCRHCGETISEDRAPLIEVDEEGREQDLGLVHESCRRALDRVLGFMDCALFRGNPQLRNFDYRGWVESLPSGQWLFGGLRNAGPRAAPVAWKSQYDDFSKGTWCVRADLEDGSARYVTDRGRVARRSQQRALQDAQEMNRSLEEARKKGDPWCYSPDGDAFGPYSVLLAGGVDPVECEKAVACRYTRPIGEAYSQCENYYAPLAYLTDAVSGDPVVVEGVITMLTDPLQLPSYLANWRKCGIELPDFTVSTLLSDERFDRFMGLAMAQGLRVIIDPKLKINGDLASGYVIEHFESLVAGPA